MSSENLDNETVYILDSYGLIYRCYFAFITRPIMAKGKNVSAIFGFFKSLAQVFSYYKPKYLIAAFDSKTPTFRHKMYDQYKATRQKTPEDLFPQIDRIEEILNEMNIPVYRADGYEADDVIATVAKKCKEKNLKCRILSGDKDLMQLVDDTTFVLKPSKDTNAGSGWELLTEAGVLAEWGVSPKKLLDLLSLMGDSADNVPGCPGIGIKTGVKLISEYGDLDGIFAHASEIKGSTGQKIISGMDSTKNSRELIKLCNTAPLPENFEDFLKQDIVEYNFQKASEIFKDELLPQVSKAYGNLCSIKNSETNTAQVVKVEKENTETSSEKIDFSAQEEELLPIRKNQGNYKAITEISELKKYIAKAKETSLIAYDSETNGLDSVSAKILGFSLSYKKGEGVYIPLGESDSLFDSDKISKEEAFSALEEIFSSPYFTIIFHNAKFDLKILISNGFKIPLDEFKCHIKDTMIAAWLLSPDAMGKSSYSLERLAEVKLGLVGIEFDEIVAKGETFDTVPLEIAANYASEDADFTLQLWEKLEVELKNKNLLDLYENLELPLLPVLSQMELEGIHLDTTSLKAYNVELTENLKFLEEKIYKEVGHEFNIASTKQLQTVLFEERGLPPSKKTKTGYSTDTSVLEELSEQDIVCKLILEYREMAKLQSTYVETLPKLVDKNNRIHTNFVQTGTATGRLSCKDPNLQNIPVRNEAGRKIRTAFTAPKGKVLISADYSQIELVVLSHLSGDENMSKAFMQGIDVHKATASLIFGVSPENVSAQMRRTAKTINFGVIYGMSAFRLAKDLEISRTQAQNFIQAYFETYHSIKEYMDGVIQKAEETGYVETLMGRIRKIPYINTRNKTERAAAERTAINTPVQGSAADIVKKAMLNVSKALKESNSPAKLLLQVHDELILECPDEETHIQNTIKLIRENMEKAVTLNVPLKVSIEYGKNWGEFH